MRQQATRVFANLVHRFPKLEEAVARQAGPCPLPDLSDLAGGRSFVDAASLVEAMLHVDPAPLLGEWEQCRARIDARSRDVGLRYPAKYGVERESATFLYAATRVLRPEVILEIGVADGWSTAALLAALDANGQGALHSIDIADDVGILADASSSRWTLHVERGPGAVGAVAARLAPVDLYLHDAKHNYRAQMADHEAVLPALAPSGAWLMSDDADASWAFYDLCRRRRLDALFLVDSRKVLGVAGSSPS